jgi:glyoxylase-like metal-dependent hydrolase (beta-lactamase superfamily II)/ferredoxin
MANPAKRLEENVPGDFFVDDSCIDCDACRQIAPGTFRDHGDQSSVFHQPILDGETFRALQALVACPTGSIGTVGHQNVKSAIRSFPSLISENVYFCGFTSESSFGAWSYLIVRPDSEGGNVLVDSPRYSRQLVENIEKLGGVSTILLSHVDDIADHARFSQKFGARRLMHADDGAGRYGIEQVIEGTDTVRLDHDFQIIPTPGHTRGHMVFLYRNKYLFTGDHLAWSPEEETLTAFRSACWYSWSIQINSMTRLLDYEFEWVLPGHGRIHHDSKRVMHANLERCVEWMKTRS